MGILSLIIMENMKFSILMPTFDRKEFLRGAVEAVLAQSYKNYELIIKEGCKKSVFDVLDGLDLSKITLIFNEDSGITDAMNQMLEFASGDVFIWANDDDRLRPKALEIIANSIGSYQWGFGKMRTTDGQVLGCPANLGSLKNGNCICQPTVFWTRRAYQKVGKFNENLDLVSDYEYWVRLMRDFQPIFINEIIAIYGIHEHQLTNTKRSIQLGQAKIIMDSIC